MRRWLVTVSVGAALGLALAGCREDEPEFKAVTLLGTVEEIEKIDASTARVEISYYSEKYNQERTDWVIVTPQTEILINGELARLDDVKIGERAEGTAIVTSEGDKRVITVKRVRIERAEPIVPATAADDLNPPRSPAAPADGSGGN